ncbi:DUF1481 domain-containing protein [Escherichia coli]
MNIRARFDDCGDSSFMQRESDGKQQLSNDQIDLYRYRADHSPDERCLTLGESRAAPGRWHAMNRP